LVMMVINHPCRLPCWYRLNLVNARISVSCTKSSVCCQAPMPLALRHW